jgi:hypothetical protein
MQAICLLAILHAFKKAFGVSSWPGFVPAIHVLLTCSQHVDARHKAGHDDLRYSGEAVAKG